PSRREIARGWPRPVEESRIRPIREYGERSNVHDPTFLCVVNKGLVPTFGCANAVSDNALRCRFIRQNIAQQRSDIVRVVIMRQRARVAAVGLVCRKICHEHTSPSSSFAPQQLCQSVVGPSTDSLGRSGDCLGSWTMFRLASGEVCSASPPLPGEYRKVFSSITVDRYACDRALGIKRNEQDEIIDSADVLPNARFDERNF